jgi:NAD kinase
VTPIAPHSLSFRPIILPAHVEIKIKVPSTSRTAIKVTVDGHTRLDLNSEDYLVIKKSPYDVPCKLLYLLYINGFSCEMEQ